MEKIDAYLEETDEIIMEYETAIAERERVIKMEKIDAYLEETDEIIMEYETAIAERERVIKENQEAIREYEEILESYLLLKTILEA